MDVASGVYFRREDYAGFWRRLLIDVVDVCVVAASCLTVAATCLVLAGEFGEDFSSSRIAANVAFASCIAVVGSYFVILKRSRIGTVGYRVGGVKVVNLHGRPPSWFSMGLRFLFGFSLGPLSLFVDLIWLSGDSHRQALRDKLANTYVVRTTAQPVGSGRIVYRNYDILGYNFTFREVEVQEPARTDA